MTIPMNDGATITILCVACVGTPLPVIGQEAASASMKTLQAVRTDQSITIDGRLDESAWMHAAVVEDLHQILPVEYAQPSQQTRFLVLYDSEALYVAAEMYDTEPERMTAKVLRQGGESWRDDQFDLLLDPFNDKRSGYRFQVNPNGVYDEGLFKGPTQMQWEWNGIWQVATTRNDEGWIAEASIPFKTVSFNPDSDTWGINFARKVARDNETMGWVSRNRTQSPAISGELSGLAGLEQGLGLDVVPALVVNERRTFSAVAETSEVEPSLDVFYKLTPALNASLTLNTDFSATEVDDRQVNLTRFGLFFPEQRDFFLQDADIFEFGRLGQRENGSPFSRPLAENARPFSHGASASVPPDNRSIWRSAASSPAGSGAGTLVRWRSSRRRSRTSRPPICSSAGSPPTCWPNPASASSSPTATPSRTSTTRWSALTSAIRTRACPTGAPSSRSCGTSRHRPRA